MKKLITFVLSTLVCLGAFGQNIQLHYDFGHNIYKNDLSSRARFTTTVENFKADNLGSTYFFVDMDYLSDTDLGIQSAYWEISREFNFWQNSWLAAHVEYNGGLSNSAGTYNDAWLLGLAYNGHSEDYSKTWSIQAMYKVIPDHCTKAIEHSFQITGVWNINFAKNWLTFSGYIDFWKEYYSWQNTHYLMLTEPQFWINFNQINGMKANISLGTEIKVYHNFVGKGTYCIPTIALKYTL